MLETIVVTEPYLELDCGLGEAPYYDPETDELRFVDIIKKELHCVSLKDGPGSHKVISLEDSIGVTANIHGSPTRFMAAAKGGFAVFDKVSGKMEYVKRTFDDDEELRDRMRFNDGAVDTRGRFWAGSMNDFHVKELQPEGTVFRLDPDLALHRMIEGVTVPNGMAWSPDDKTMYVTDSTSRGIFAYDYDADAGRISNKRFFFKLSDADEGVMDGCAIDTEGNIWAAVHWGSRILKISPKGEALLQITLPAWKPSCPAFGGASMNELFITTAAIEEGETAPLESGQHGSLFRVTVNATGLTRNKFGAATARLN